jgi:histidine triad (HIT) family protein
LSLLPDRPRPGASERGGARASGPRLPRRAAALRGARPGDPHAHLADLAALTPDDQGALFDLARRIALALEPALGAGGALVALNNKVSQSVPHLHLHVVPRQRGDGLRGFFWPRRRYASEAARDELAGRIGKALGAIS